MYNWFKELNILYKTHLKHYKSTIHELILIIIII